MSSGARTRSRCAVALGYLAALLVVPVGMVFYRAFENGFATALGGRHHADGPARVQADDHDHAIAVPLNTVFGVV